MHSQSAIVISNEEDEDGSENEAEVKTDEEANEIIDQSNIVEEAESEEDESSQSSRPRNSLKGSRPSKVEVSKVSSAVR